MPIEKSRAAYNRTVTLTPEEEELYLQQVLSLNSKISAAELKGKIIQGDLLEVLPFLPEKFIDLLIIDPPYNMRKSFGNDVSFKEMKGEDYESYIRGWLLPLIPALKADASIYFCCEWKSSPAVYNVLSEHFIIRNRITWEREKGRGAKANWKNCSEDIWYCTLSKDFVFNTDAVKVQKRVIAPYKDENGLPKDWVTGDVGNVRLTHPSNIWTDITVPFWSMTENTDHPTQKPEKLLAKIILASSHEGDFVFDPFLGAGSTAVAAKKLNRAYSGVEIDKHYCAVANKRLAMAEENKEIQGYRDGLFLERNFKNKNA